MKNLIAIMMLISISTFAGVKEDVSATVNMHFKAIETGEIQLLEKAWLKTKAQISEIKKDEVIKHDINKTFNLWTRTKNPKLKGSIVSITEITPELAVAKVSLNWKGDKYTDALTLTKTSKGWKIINKTYAAPKAAKSSYGF